MVTIEETKREFAARLQAARVRANMTQEQLAAYLGTSVWAVRHWEGGDSLPRTRAYVNRVRRFIAEAEAGRIAPLRKRWTRRWAQCRECGTTDRPHYGRGYCEDHYKLAVAELRAERAAAPEPAGVA